MNWYKKAQFTEENTQNINTPIIMVQPYEPIVQEVVDELYNENPQVFININRINVDMGYGQFGSVVSDNPADININLNNIKNEVSSKIITSFDINNEKHKMILKNEIKRIIIHEKEHVQDAFKAQEGSEDPLEGQELFPGGEGVAERAEQQYSPRVANNKSKKIIKLAAYDYKGQEGDTEDFGDFQRYNFDAYITKVYITKTNKKITVSCTVTNEYIGTVILNNFWDFKLDEEKKARKVYKEVKKVVKDTMAKFVKEEIPTSMYYASLRKSFYKVNNSDMTKTNIPWINYSYKLDYEDDWRKSIYGNRYPEHKEESFNQYKEVNYYQKENYNKGKFYCSTSVVDDKKE